MCFSEYWRSQQMRYSEAMWGDIQLNEHNEPRGYYLRCPFFGCRVYDAHFFENSGLNRTKVDSNRT